MTKETTNIQDSQTFTMEDLDESKIDNSPVFVKCDSCGKISKEDNFLGNPETCKHWCNKCFIKIKNWVERKNQPTEKINPQKLLNKFLKGGEK